MEDNPQDAEEVGTVLSSTPAGLAAVPTQSLGSVACWAFGGAALMSLCLSPWGLGQLAFVSVAPWAWLTLDARRITTPGYLLIYMSGIAHWIALSLFEFDLGQGRLLSSLPVILYLSLYAPLFVALGRTARGLIWIPSYLVLPIIWCGLESIRCNLFGGFSLGLLAHAAADSRRILQLTDIAGSHGLGMIMVASGASVAELLWIARGIRILEKRIPADVAEHHNRGSAFTAAGRLAWDAFALREGAKSSATRSMEAVLRRSRDRAKEIRLTSVTLSVLVVASILVLANSYGSRRVNETASWKLFDSNQYPVSVLGGPQAASSFADQARSSSGSLLVASVQSNIEPSVSGGADLPPTARPTLLTTEGSTNRQWDATLCRGGKCDRRELKRPTSGSRIWARPAVVQTFSSDPKYVPLNIMTTVAPNANIEATVHAAIDRFPNHGRALDVVVVTIEPNELDGTRWPRLMTRSVIASSVANRCPVIALVPDQLASVATGDGKLWWSASSGDTDSAGDPNAEGMRINGPISVQAMIDPRVARYAQIGHLPATASVIMTLFIPIASAARRRRRTPRRREDAPPGDGVSSTPTLDSHPDATA